MRQLLLTLARDLVREPQRVRVDEEVRGDLTSFELHVAPDDRGAVIGRRGRTAGALRDLLGAVARTRGERCRLEICD